MDQDQRLALLELKVTQVYESVEKIRKYFLWTGIITVALFVLPLIGLMFAIPSFLSSYDAVNTLDSLDTLQSLTQ